MFALVVYNVGMNYLNLEMTLNKITGYGMVDGPFYGMAGALENILKDPSLKPAERADKLTDLISDAWAEHKKKIAQAGGSLDFLTPEEYGLKIGKSAQMVRRYISQGRIPAYIFGKGKNRKLVIPNKLPDSGKQND